MDGSNEITQVSDKSGHGDIKLPPLNPYLAQSEAQRKTSSDVKRFPFFIEGFVSPEISYRALATNAQYSIPDYDKTYFNKKEKADFTFSAGVLGGFNITENIILKTGAFYSRYSLKFKTEAIYVLKSGVDSYLIYTSSGQVNVNFKSSDSISKESFINSSINFSYLNIPLIAELHFRNNYFLDLGLNFNMLVGQNMNWQAENFNGNFSNAIGDTIDGLETVNICMIAGFGIDKPLTSKLSLIINPTLKIYLTSINKVAPVKSFPYYLGLNIGLRYYFN
jgi:hypothetical protein